MISLHRIQKDKRHSGERRNLVAVFILNGVPACAGMTAERLVGSLIICILYFAFEQVLIGQEHAVVVKPGNIFN